MPNSCKSFLKIYEDRIQILLILDVLFDEDLQVEYLFCGATSCSETQLTFLQCGWCLLWMIFNMTLHSMNG